MLEFVSKIDNKRVRNRQIFKPKHKVISIHLLPNGEILTHALKTEFKVVSDPSGQSKVVDGPQTMVYYRSKAVVVASGAQ